MAQKGSVVFIGLSVIRVEINATILRMCEPTVVDQQEREKDGWFWGLFSTSTC